MTADVRRTVGAARAVFVRLDEDATRHLEQSWRGHAGRRALEALRRYISDALDGLAGQPSFPVMSVPAAPALTSAGTPAGTVPAGLGGDPPMSTAPMANNHNGFDGDRFSTPTHTSASPHVTHSPAPSPRPMLNAESPPPTASFNTPTGAATPSSPPANSSPAAQSRAGFPYLPMMAGGYPGAIARDGDASRGTPGYLISIDNGNEFIGPLPKVTPPVIGGG
jgi:hypothetical protein